MAKQWVIIILCGLLMACFNDDTQTVQGYIEGEFVYVASDNDGVLNTLLVTRGQPVSMNDPLFTIEGQSQQATLAQARANLASAKATLQDIRDGARPDELAQTQADIESAMAQALYYKKEAGRYKKLSESDNGTQSDYEKNWYRYQSLQALVEKYQASMRQARLGSRENQIQAQAYVVQACEAAVQLAEWELAQNKVASPITGLVFDTYYWPGEYVARGHAVASILAPEHVQALFFVPEPMLSTIKVGDIVQVRCDSCQKRSATIRYISTANEYTPPVMYSEAMRDQLVYEVKADFSPDIALQFHPGQPVTITLVHAR
jgi:HlyD family secretion protein